MASVLAWAAALSLILGRSGTPAEKLRADRIFVNGNVWTGDWARPRAQAIAVRGPTILAIGTNEEIRKRKEKLTDIVDLKGRFVFPGFNDAHLHLIVLRAELGGVTTLEQLQHRLREYARAHPDAAWIQGRGWTYDVFPAGVPHRKYLDAALPDRAVILIDRDGHGALVNSVALAAAGISRSTGDPPNGTIVRDASGEATGLFKEAAMQLVVRHLPEPSSEDRYRALKQALQRAASSGLTSVQNASHVAEELPVYERVLAEGSLNVRVSYALPFAKDATPEDLIRYKALRERHRSGLFKFGAAKGVLDGVVDARTAAMLEPYTGGGNGTPMWRADELERAAVLYDREGFQIMLHAIGDKAIRMALDAYEHVARTNGPARRRHRIEHVEVPHPADLPRFKSLGVIASTQALFANPDKATLEHYSVLLGPERAGRANAFKPFDDLGVVQAFGSDWPVFSMETLKGIYCAVTRMTPEGTPPGGYYPEHRISVETALRHFTRDAAYASFDEGIKGTLAPEKLADFVVLSEDIVSVPPERILKTRVLLTVMGGRDTYRAPEF